MHRAADAVQAAVDIPLIHIADATADAITAAGIGHVALLGTRFTMEEDFYRGRLESRYGLEVAIPDEPDRKEIHRVIYEELVRGVVSEESRKNFLEIIERLIARGAEGVIAGCTEIELLVEPRHVVVPYFPTTRIHAIAAVEWALDD
jgi:aspartate racemase